VELAHHAEAEGLRIHSMVEEGAVHRIHSMVEEGAVHRIPAVAAGPVDQAAEGHRIPAVAAGPVDQAAEGHRTPAVAMGPVDHACPFHPVLLEEELQMVQDLQGCRQTA
jgi:hypothetical protein